MKVLVIQGALSGDLVSGEEVVVSKDVEFLKKEHEVFYANIKLPVAGYARIISRLSGLLWSFKYYFQVRCFIREFSPDIIHFHTTIPYLSISVLIAAFKSRIPIVQTLHNARWLCVEGGFYRNDTYCDDCVGSFGWKGVVRGCSKGRVVSFISFLANFLMRKTSYLHNHISSYVAVSEFVRQQHIKSFFPAEKIITRNNGFDSSLVDISLPEKKSGIVFAGRISAAKGSLTLRKLISQLTCEINIIGNGPDEESLKQYCEENGYSHVRFWGRLSNTKTVEIIGSSVLSVIPSQCGDSFPTAALESIAVGTPVIATAVGGLPELIKKSSAGFVVPYDMPDKFVAEVERLYSDSLALQKMSDNGKKYIKENLTLEHQGRKLVEIYRDILSDRL